MLINKLCDNNSKLNKIDYIIIFIMILLYSLISFYNLGDLNSPNTYYHFKRAGDSIVINLDEEKYISKIRYYSGNNLSSISVMTSLDGIEYKYIDLFTVQSVFKWFDFDINTNAKYIKFVANSSDSCLGDIVLYDKDNSKILIKKDKNNPLLDEMDLVPQDISYLNSTYFDEIYYARSAYEYANGINVYEWTHPPLGKLIITIPVLIFGFSPFTYRLIGNIFGILLIPLMYILTKKLFKNRKYAILGGILMMFDNFHFAHTRIALIDGIQLVFILLSIIFMINYLELDKKDKFKRKIINLLLSGFFIGCSISVKWNAMYIGLGLFIVFIYKIYLDYHKCFKDKELLKLFFISLISFILIPITIYVLCYILFPNVSNYNGTLKGIIDQIKLMYNYHSNFYSAYPDSSKWYQWPIMYKPIRYYSELINGMKRVITGIGNPIIWWFGIISFIYLLISSFKDKDNRFILIFILVSFIPYIFVKRTMFIYHYFITLPFIMLGIVSFIKWITEKFKTNKFYILYIIIVIIGFIIFYPVVSGIPVSEKYINLLKWLSSWNF